jgi:hypothetical protein
MTKAELEGVYLRIVGALDQEFRERGWLPPALPQSPWQPIETKPKDHFPVMVWGPFGHRVAFEDVTWTWYEPAMEEPMDWKPSHWMPLPTRPDTRPLREGK